ncbi:DeoR/GlpR family DNA-binding transcription regulator [Martelella endophytica]|uniref:DeoR/GlpR family DNA-binding transcription regulator n=1 Tax=Martelella endophytica TaxID=1486262 RepID=UPI0005F10783|nr:DeoR/GlpR family DNA-binding transcription regulator [Martelella endophytica]
MNDYLIRERQDIILKRLKASGRVLAAELATEFAVSEDTIRRDLRAMAARGLCERVYGGALSVTPGSGDLKARTATIGDEKRALARLVAGEIAAGISVFLDAASTNIAVAQALPQGLDATVITNSPAIAAALDGRHDVSVIVIGGLIHRDVGGAIGARALEELSEFHLDLCVLGACAVDIEAGLTCFHYEDALFKRKAAARARRVVAAMTAEKFSTRAPCAIVDLAMLDALAVSDRLDAGARQALAASGVRFLAARQGEVMP